MSTPLYSNNSIVIVLHKQTQNICKILKSLDVQTHQVFIAYLVFDRASDDPLFNKDQLELEISSLNLKFKTNIITPDAPTLTKRSSSNFFAGYCRNVGIDAAINDGADIVTMIDGDCLPQQNLLLNHTEQCKYKIPILSCGKRREHKYGWKDRRECDSGIINYGLFRKNTIINDSELLKQCIIVWSCNIAINIDAINRIKKFNEMYYGRSEVFCSDFNGEWGGEDSFLGIQAWICRVIITTTPGSAIEHIDHPPHYSNALDHKTFFDNMVSDIRTKTFMKPVLLDFFTA